MALLHRLLLQGERPTVCHVDHGGRPGAADAGKWVQARCEELSLPCVVRTVRPSGRSEAAMRDARYAALLHTALDRAVSEIATGHTLDDQAETVLLRLERGTRIKGLGGIPPSRSLGSGVRVVRPLLRERRADLRAWLRARGVEWLEDPSNRDRAYARNRLRADGLPLDPEVLARVAEAAREAWTALAARAPDARDLAALSRAPRSLRRVALERLAGGSLTERHVVALERLAEQREGSATVSLPGGRRVVRQYDKLYSDPLPSGPSVLTFSLVSAGPGTPPARDAWEAWFDADAVRFPLTVRTRRPGDRIRPLGGRGSRKVQDALVDAKVPRAQREELPLVVQGEEVIWIPGVLRGATAPIDGMTTRVLRMGREPL